MHATIAASKAVRVRGAQRLTVMCFAAASITPSLSFARSSFISISPRSSLCTPTRRYTNVLYRLPPTQVIPTHSPSGEEVDTELFIRQVKNFFNVLRQTQLIELVYEMKSCPYYECLFTNDLFFQHYDVLLPMPKFGRENRSAEISETIRYMRGWGATADVNHILQDVKNGRTSGGDFISTTHGILMGYGTPRTNKLAMMTLTGGNADSDAAKTHIRSLSVEPVEMLPDSPPLSDLLAFSGQRTFVFADSEHGHRAVSQAMKRMPKVPWQTIKMEPQCSFFSHMAGANYVYDVLCDQDFPVSLERLGESGLNPFPVEWSEPRKLGITMRSICLTARFARGSMNAGGFANSSTHQAAGFTYNSRNMSKNSRLFAGGHRKHGDQMSPLAAQLEAEEIQKPVYQPVPRYAPPLHRRGSLVPSCKSSEPQ
ncbi:hypothetical protein ABL78_4419 [Leptomonas seymouri]|uniref:RNA-editing substrate-binding complex 5 protein domain-containing protein n=1 Tax=Leptomonas seymouri TaxID=5684 RepID=A0A0N0P5Y0_LEPSE|nr:hypothetical protein ABL78_4419 [Leptomonas seymouri]|eukprot:KPI86517.1 hypothetical protein ABL78_4419 [Leptomonas seymouri]